jgi:hypothetical protein
MAADWAAVLGGLDEIRISLGLLVRGCSRAEKFNELFVDTRPTRWERCGRVFAYAIGLWGSKQRSSWACAIIAYRVFCRVLQR